MNKKKLLNLDSLYEMASGDKDFINQIAEEFELVAREALVRLNGAIVSKNLSDVRKAVHRIKPNFSYLGMDDQARTASQIIVKIDQGHDQKEILGMVRPLIEDIQQALKEVEDVKPTWK